MAKVKAMESRFFVDYCTGDRVRILKKNIPDKQTALDIAKKYLEKYRKKWKEGVISVYTISYERGAPMQKMYEVYEVHITDNQ